MGMKLKYEGKDDWGRKTYRILGTKRRVKDVDGKLYYATNYGEPDTPVRREFKIIK